MRVLVVNTGSTSLKLTVLDGDDTTLGRWELGPIAEEATRQVLTDVLRDDGGPRFDAVGHRIVHGGDVFDQPVVIDDTAFEALTGLGHLAPLHNPPALQALAAVREARPEVPAVACFDTAFHATLPAPARTWAVPWRWTTEWGLRRYGFHGLSHQRAASRAAQLLGRSLDGLRLVTCHLGGGSSLAAVAGGRSVDTTMGYTPLDGLVMGTRSGSVDPSVVIEAQRRGGLDADEVERQLNEDAGLAGLSGVSHDLRDVFAAAAADDERAALALDVYHHRLRAGIAAMAAAMGGLDALVFSGEAGAGWPPTRAATVHGLGFLGAHLDDDANVRVESSDAIISPADSPVAVLVVAPQEDLTIAAETRRALDQDH